MGLVLNIQGESSEGPFGFIASVGDVTVDVLKQGLPADLPATQGDVVGQTVTVVSQSGADGQAGPAGAPGADSGAAVEPNLDGLFATDTGNEDLHKQVLADFTRLPAGMLTLAFSAYARALGGATGTFRLRLGGTDGAVDGTLLATLTATSTSFQMLTTSASISNPTGRVLVKLTGQSNTLGLDAQVKSTVAIFQAS
jgi:hypothetical protein